MDGVTLEAREVSRTYGGSPAVRNASLRAEPGRIHAIVGENGAGKSTLLKMLAGAVVPSGGSVLVAGRPLDPATPAEAIRRGVGLVYQHFSLVEAFTGLENLMLGFEPVGRFGVLRVEDIRAKALDVSARTGLAVSLDALAGDLGVGEKQRLEILRVLVRGARALLLDEPTAVLTRGEAASLYALLRRVADEGATVIVVTHHLEEVVTHADDVTVMRRGEVVHTGIVRGTSVASLAAVALGEIADVRPPPPVSEKAPVVLAVANLSVGDDTARGLRDVMFEVRAGEIVGIAGIDGNGQDALVAALAGLISPSAGSLSLVGIDITRATIHARRKAGLEVVHGDRHRFGVILDATLHDNLVLGDAGSSDEDGMAARRLAASRVAPADETLAVRSLSGGNQQKLVLARVLDRAPKLLLAAYPTRGIDAAAAAELRGRLIAAAASGSAIVLLSAELDELRALSHRLLVMSQGRIVAELPSSATESDLGAAMLGGATA